MPIVDLICKAVNDDPSVPYYHTSAAIGQRRLRSQAGEVVEWRNDEDFPGQPLSGYGIVSLVSRNWRVIRVTDALAGDGDLLAGQDTLSLEDLAKGFPPRRKVWRIRLKDVPQSIKNKLIPRKYPDIDHQFFLNHPNIRAALLAKYPALADVPQNQRRSTPWDVSVTRAQIAPYFRQKINEPRDVDGFPVDDLEPLHDIDLGDEIR